MRAVPEFSAAVLVGVIVPFWVMPWPYSFDNAADWLGFLDHDKSGAVVNIQGLYDDLVAQRANLGVWLDVGRGIEG
jgi:hypothetical protein